MEVHAHTHTERKKWTHYFWEFLMLFLAVFCGFFAENQREHYIEKQRAKEFAESMVADLALDVSNLDFIIKEYDSAARNVDSFLRIVSMAHIKSVPGGAIYYYGDAANSGYRMAFNTATIEQLKSSGSLRYFPIRVRSKISKYDQFMQEFNLRQNNEPLFNIETRKYFEKIFDNSVLEKLYKTIEPDSLEKFRQTDYALMNTDMVLLKEYANNCFSRKENWRNRITTALIPLRKKATELIEILNEEYQLK
jgi:hypothetical protein